MESDDEGNFRRRDKFLSERLQHPRERGLLPSPPPYRRLPPFRPPPMSFPYPPPSPRGRGEDPRPSLLGSPPSKRARGPPAPPAPFSSQVPGPPARKPTKPSGSDAAFQPVIMTFKAFLATQDDLITDEEAAAKYGEYKLEFRRQQLNEFFVLHRGEEWFQEKYHPVHSKEREKRVNSGVRKRLEVFLKLHTKGEAGVGVCQGQQEGLARLLDSAVVLLEGGGEEDLARLQENAKDTKEDALNLTSSLFLKSLPPSVTREELHTLCSKFPGYLRLCITDPDSSKQWQRRAWVTFRHNTPVREICYSLNNTKLRGSELRSLVNKPLSQRIRVVSPIYWDSRVARAQVLLSSNLIRALDTKQGLWQDGSNPVLSNIQDLMVEEVSAEEDELLGGGQDEQVQVAMTSVESEPALLAALDRLVLYLRLVHSVDLYTGAHYYTEEEMPSRCGIFHVRADLPEDFAITPANIQAQVSECERVLAPLLKPAPPLTDPEAARLGMKTEADEVEKFIVANCQEIAQDKWLCPLSGKKFKGPDFIRKHIQNKYSDKVEEVRKDTDFFNNYLRDAHRPELPVLTSSTVPQAGGQQREEVEHRPPPPASGGGRKRMSVHSRLGRPGEVRVTQAAPDPRDIVDYSDVDLVGLGDFF